MTDDEEEVERIAKRLYQEMPVFSNIPWDKTPESWRGPYRKAARTMRELIIAMNTDATRSEGV